MKKQDDYVAGPHHYWTHFWCGLVFGAGIGTWIGLFTVCLGFLDCVMTMTWPNQAAPKPTFASGLDAGHLWRGDGDPGR